MVKLTTLTTVATGLLLAAYLFLPIPGSFRQWQQEPAIAQQRIRASEIPEQVYRLLPDLPLENHYINVETGEASPNNTLISRLIRYHTFIKGRSPNFRLDWKLTLADYLGANERISATAYPGADILRTNPLEGDVAIIRQLNRRQRDQLVQVLVSLYTPASEAPAPSPTPTPTPTPEPPPIPPRPGDARLLLP